MKNLIPIIAALNILFLIMHEYDAFHKGEWKMLKFLNKLNESTQYLIFLYLHIPLTLFCLYYLWSVINQANFLLWLIVNIFSIIHLILHLFARKWKSNVFINIHSFIFILGWAITGITSLLLLNYY